VPDDLDSEVEIGGHPVRAGRLTVAAACEIESFLQTLESPIQFLESRVLGEKLPRYVPDPDNPGNVKEVNSVEVADILLQRSMEWPPDAIGALCNTIMLKKGAFSRVFIMAMVRAYNPHFTPEKIEEIADSALAFHDAVKMQMAALGVNTDPKDGAGLGVASNPPNESNGAGLSPS
jgi:hypothetical protein